MNLFEYIKSQLPSMPNASIMKNMGASDELVEYVKKTPWNTNLGILGVYGCDGGTDGEVWYTGTLGECQNGFAEAELSETDKANTTDILANPSAYTVVMNGIELQLSGSIGTMVEFSDNPNTPTVFAGFGFDDGHFEGVVEVQCPTDITTVEVMVAKK